MTPLPRAAWLAPLVGLLATTPAAGPPPALTMEPTRIVATTDLAWAGRLTFTNPGRDSLRLDRLEIVVDDHDAGETRAPRESRLSLARLTPLFKGLAPYGEGCLNFEEPAVAESASLRIEARLIDRRGGAVTMVASAEAVPGPSSRRYPSELLNVAGRQVEVVPLASASILRPAPGVLLVHGHGHHARQMLRGARRLALAGYAVMLVSMPGYGLSEGPPDFTGPRTIEALAAALDRLERTPGVNPARIAAWGVSRGATAVTLLAERRPELAAVIAQAGLYDVGAMARGAMDPGIRSSLIAEAGGDSMAWRERSPALAADRLKAPILVMHGEDDVNAPAGQAHAFVDALQARHATVEAHFFPGQGHMLPREQTSQLALAFLARTLAH